MDEITLSNATIFRYACDTLVEKMNQGFFESDTNVQQEEKTKLKQSLVVPVIVNASFACELFLKSLLPSNTHGHKLDELFSQLDQNLQSKIMGLTGLTLKCYNDDYNMEQFQQDLKNNSNDFAEWRYFHEGHSQRANLHFLLTFLNVLNRVALEQKAQESSSN
mgnify:FL=1